MISTRLAPPRATVVPNVWRSFVEGHALNTGALARGFEADAAHAVTAHRQARLGVAEDELVG